MPSRRTSSTVCPVELPVSSTPWETGNADDEFDLFAPTWTAESWAAMGYQWAHSELPSVQACRRSCIPGNSVDVTLDGRARASAAGLRTCGSVWACPLCSRAIWAKRCRELSELLSAAVAEDVSVAMVTLTMRHGKRHRLAELWDAMRPACKAAMGAGSRTVRALREEMDVLGVARRTEATYGVSGWHLHIHVLVFAGAATAEDFDALGAAMFEAWADRLHAHGLPRPTTRRGVHVKLLDRTADIGGTAAYVTAAGSFHAAAELTDNRGKSARHGNRTTWELLDAARGGDAESARLWAEWERASKGKQAWDMRSPRLRDLAARHPATSEPDESSAPSVLASVSEDEWKELCRVRQVGRVLAAAESAFRVELLISGDRMAAIVEARREVVRLLYKIGVLGYLTLVGWP